MGERKEEAPGGLRELRTNRCRKTQVSIVGRKA
jgi:hypothetical protein